MNCFSTEKKKNTLVGVLRTKITPSLSTHPPRATLPSAIR